MRAIFGCELFAVKVILIISNIDIDCKIECEIEWAKNGAKKIRNLTNDLDAFENGEGSTKWKEKLTWMSENDLEIYSFQLKNIIISFSIEKSCKKGAENLSRIKLK